jgi:transcriptional regulator GlxA family with amidase domain
MTLNSATRLVVIVVYPGVTTLDVTGPAQVFSEAGHVAEFNTAPFMVVLGSITGGPIESDTGIVFQTTALGDLPNTIDTLIVSGGLGVFEAAEDRELLHWVAARSSTARRTASTCLGAFVIAGAGLFNGKRAVTHWRWCDTLRLRHPEVIVVPDRMYVQDGEMWSSAGVTAGIDLALAMVEADLGRDIALSVARSLVVLLKRPGGQTQYGLNLGVPPKDPSGRFNALHEWLMKHLNEDLRVERLAERAAMSPRTFARTYASVMKTTPARAVEIFRLEAARHLLEADNQPLKAVADHCGFRTVDRLRRAFLRHFGVLPNDYRNHFGARGS